MRVCHIGKHGSGQAVFTNEYRDAVKACPDCQATQLAERERIQRECTIDPNYEYGSHIALTCLDHPELRWSTKNIDYIGARSIFFNGGDECDCHVRRLVTLAKYWQLTAED